MTDIASLVTADSIPPSLASLLPADTLLTRRELAEASSKAGLPVAEASLASMATRGTGPTFCRYGRAVRYRWGDFLSWAASRTTVGASTSEHRAKAAA
ncbi:helix-turn-helix transcriptional regulator [Methylocystis echinoides]|uniref:DNA-binding protein n=1 Tax=Methylocystis echinoides TaxID=29468 RepID=A0A9W6GTV9_9HYPH|nr:hypothetical protein [Methylocystis echinoides]GLI92987.1 hypothetical protein LMG27198_19790 [Methylocystis echinoides]